MNAKKATAYSLYALAGLASLALFWMSLTKRLPDDPWTEVLAVVTGAWCTWLIAKDHIWNWPIGIANCIFTCVVLFGQQLWGDFATYVMFTVLNILGWYWWLHGGQRKAELPITWSSPRLLAISGVVGLLGAAVFYKVLVFYKDSLPVLDALGTSFSLVAQYLVTRKKIENWITWAVVDVIFLYTYWIKHLNLLALLNILYIVIALIGHRAWVVSNRTNQVKPQPA